MDRYEFVRNHIHAFEHEYKLLMAGKMQVEQLPVESIQGILYQLLQQLMDCEISIAKFDNHIEFLDEMLEDYYFEDYLGMSIPDVGGKGNPIISIMGELNNCEEEMTQYKDGIKDIVKQLFQRLFVEEKYATEFFGTEECVKKANDLWKKEQFMDVLVDNMIMEFDDEIEIDRIQQVIDDIFTYEEVNHEKFKIVDYKEPFN